MSKPKGIPKINSIHFGGAWISIGLLIGGVIPLILWFIFHKIFWIFIIPGVIILLAFVIVFSIEMEQDNGDVPYYEKHLKDTISFDPEKQYAVIRSSICTGEKVAGFKNKDDGHFTEVMLIRSRADEERFKAIYKVDKIKTEY